MEVSSSDLSKRDGCDCPKVSSEVQRIQRSKEDVNAEYGLDIVGANLSGLVRLSMNVND